MKDTHSKIIQILSEFLEKNPEQRFGQALFNLNINQHKYDISSIINPSEVSYQMRDIYNDSDKCMADRVNESGSIFNLESAQDVTIH
jgi:hypothetical protein